MSKSRMSSLGFITSVSLLLLFLAAGVRARPTTPQEALLVAWGWLAGNAEPLGTPLGNRPVDVETVTSAAGEPVYYVVRLHPAGVILVPADDLVEPILSFTSDPTYEPAAHDPLTALVTADVNRRLADAYAATAPGRLQAQSATDAQARWGDLIGKAGLPPADLRVLALQAVSDVRVAPFIKTRWAQDNVCANPCYNFYTPSHYPCGCMATSMAQLLYYYRWPATGIGARSFKITVLGKEQPTFTRGGDGNGGPYPWAGMVLAPDCGSTLAQRAAIGALCHDAGVAICMDYAPQGSGADAFVVVAALKSVFGFGNGVNGANNGKDIGMGLAGMVNPNLDAQYPVILGILGKSGHAALVDGYGYDTSTRIKTLYHHLNMGWAGRDDIWYNLPAAGNYDTVPVCLYNLFPEGTGEIVSGRVLDASGRALSGVVVMAEGPAKRYEAVTNDKGIYALTRLPSAGLFTLQADKPGFAFTGRTVETGTSRDRQASAGNRWAIDFIGTPAD